MRRGRSAASWQSWIAGETTRLNNLKASTITTAEANIQSDWNWLSSQTAGFVSAREASITAWVTSWDNWYNGNVTAYQNQINAWLKTQSDAIYQWYLGEWNKLEAVTSNAENWVNNEIDNYDGGKWESDIELSLTGNPFDTLTDTYHNIINTLQQEGQTDLNNAATGWNTTLQAAVSDTNATIVGFWNTYNNAVATATTAANNAVAGWETQLSNDLASIASTLSTETTLANTNVTNLQNGLPTALASAKASLQSESSTLQSDVPSLNNIVDPQRWTTQAICIC